MKSEIDYCGRCNRPLVPYHINTSFNICVGVPDNPHPDYLVTDRDIEVNIEKTSFSNGNGNGRHVEQVVSPSKIASEEVKA